MRIGLFGFTFGHENMGCQALTCAFLDILHRNFPDEFFEIVNFHDETSLGAIPDLFPDMRFSKCKVVFKDLSRITWKEIKKCNVIFDETYGDGFSDIYFVKFVYKNVITKLMCSYSGVPLILTPQTYGPFKRKSLELISGKAIRKASRVYARDQISADYAEKISNRHVQTVTDLAFALPYSRRKSENHKIKLGINISGLLWQGGFHSTNQFGLLTDYQVYCRKLICYGLNNNFEVHVIPHVTKAADSKRKVPDGDFEVCHGLAKEFPEVKLAPCFENPYDAKNYIASMNFFVGARMHATIGGFSSGVITIPFAYSRKFKGLYENLGYPYYIDGTVENTETAIQKTIEMIENPKELVKAQEAAMTIVQKNLRCFEKELVEIIHEFV